MNGPDISAGKLYLISCPLEGQALQAALPADVIETVSKLDYFLVENAKTARAFLKMLPLATKLQEIEINEFNNSTEAQDLNRLLEPARSGKSIGVLSETGSPGIADPGVNLIRAASRFNLEIISLVGPSAVMSAIMSSGLNGQNFAFNGYLPVKAPELDQKLKQLEKLANQSGQAQFFIETPYRVDKLFSKILLIMEPATLVSLSVNLGSATAYSITRRVSEWKKYPVSLDGALAVIGIGK